VEGTVVCGKRCCKQHKICLLQVKPMEEYRGITMTRQHSMVVMIDWLTTGDNYKAGVGEMYLLALQNL